jgi:hypothetical protein
MSSIWSAQCDKAPTSQSDKSLPLYRPYFTVISGNMSASGLDQSPSWKALSAHYDSMKDVTMKDMFANDPERFRKFHLEFEDLLFDFSKNRITEETMKLLYDLAAQQDVHGLAKKMFSGEKISECTVSQ